MMAVARSGAAAWQRPLVGPAVAVGLLVASIAVAVAKAPDAHRLVLGLGYLGVLALIAGYDAQTHRAPNRLIYPALAAAILASLTLGWSDTVQALLGGALSFAVLLAVAAAGRGAMGAGDVKVGALCGMALGLYGAVPMLLVTFIVGGMTAALLLPLGLRKRTDTIAFTPFSSPQRSSAWPTFTSTSGVDR